MAYQIEWAESAAKDFGKLDNSVKIPIQKFLDKLKERDDPRTMGEKLADNLADFWKYRVGDYRLVAEIQDDIFKVLMLAIGHRREVYKAAAKRISRVGSPPSQRDDGQVLEGPEKP